MDAAFPGTFNNIDLQNKHNVIAPHSPCPVLFGIRAFEKKCLLAAARTIIAGETAGRMMLFATNQGTDDHLSSMTIRDMRPFVSPMVKGTVYSRPRTDRGGHVFFELEDGTGKVDCAAYEPTKEFRAIVRSLVPGDRIVAMGGLHRRPFTLAIEKLRIIGLAPIHMTEKPRCHRCGNKMKSMGRNAGYRCRRCRSKLGRESATRMLVERSISPGQYEVPKCARRHLSMPIVR